MPPRYLLQPLRAAAAVLALGLFAACSDDDGALATAPDVDVTTTTAEDPTDPTDPTDPEPSDDAFCAAASEIADLDATYDEQLTAALDPITTAAASGDEDAMDAALDEFVDEVKRFDELLPELDAAYESLQDAAPADMQENIEILRTFTADFVAVLQEVRSFDDLEAVTEDLEGTQEAGLAAFALDGYTRDECGFSINNE